MKTRQEWLKERKQYLTASDVAAVLGVEGAFNTALDVFLDKTTPEIVENDAPILRYGHHMEPFTADLYSEMTGREVRDPGGTEIRIHPDIPWLGATLDREVLIDGEWFPLEIKQVNDPKWIFRMDEWEDSPPLKYWVQAQTQGACSTASRCFLTGQFPLCNLAIVDMETDTEFFELAFPVLDRFWNHNVKKRIPPEVSNHPKALASVRRAYRGEKRFTVVLDDDALGMANEMRDKRDKANRLKGEADQLEAQLRGQVGDGVYGALNDGTHLVRTRVERKGYTVEPCTYWRLDRKRFGL